MKTIASALIALAVVVSAAAPASALSYEQIFEQIHRNLP